LVFSGSATNHWGILSKLLELSLPWFPHLGNR
jgi:hypothetical protein